MFALPTLALPLSCEPTVLSVARTLAARLDQAEPISRPVLNAELSAAFGGSDATGRWSVRDAHAALELAQVIWLEGRADIVVGSTPSQPAQLFDQLETLLPRQTVRSDEQIELQQFATPPRLAWLAARACVAARGELVLEPSAGTGMLAVWAAKAGSRLVLNEISGLRRDCLGHLFPDAAVTAHDGELIHELLDPACRPSVILMNPPYSWSAERGRDGKTAMRHLRSAWSRLAPGGRLAAILPEWFDLPGFLGRSAGPAALRLDLAIERGFVAHGTSITTRLLVIDKVDAGGEALVGRTSDFAEQCALLEALPPRAAITTRPPALQRPIKVLPLLRPSVRPIPKPASRPSASADAAPVAFSALEVPAGDAGTSRPLSALSAQPDCHCRRC